MSPRTGNWMIAVGTLGALAGLGLAASSMGVQIETTLLALGACALSIGSLTAATGVYIKARLLQGQPGAASEGKNGQRRGRSGCDICGDTPVVNCKVHKVDLCADCLGEHYDFRSCAYVPSPRRQAAKSSTGKVMAAKVRG
jgi:hypothetical protein